MKTIEYKLKSSPETLVPVPLNYAGIAEKTIEEAKHFQNDIPQLVRDHHMRNPGIITSVTSLIECPQSLVLHDIAFLKICIYGTEQNYEVERNYAEYREISGKIFDAIEKLESKLT